MISERLKKVIFNKLYKDLRKAEIINYNGNIWFIDREKKYWYFELQKDGTLWWRYGFFNSFFELFSFDSSRFEPIIKDWVEEVLNHKVNTTELIAAGLPLAVEKVLNHKVNTTSEAPFCASPSVEKVLNHKVNTTIVGAENPMAWKINTTGVSLGLNYFLVEEVLNHKVDKTASSLDKWVGEILKCTPGTVNDHLHSFKSEVEEVLNYSVINMDGGEMIDEESFVNKVLNHKI